MNKQKIKILLKLYKKDLITDDEFVILLDEYRLDTTIPNIVSTQPFINIPQKFNIPYYTSGTGTFDGTINTSGMNSTGNFTYPQQSTIGASFSKKWNNPEEPKR